ncbi:MAG: rhodanese-like domain-containing protein, partial [Acidimicrobiales bacterium]|nr:rhodanese-like domain-containing protein [Acidimicrobiales bacterium]
MGVPEISVDELAAKVNSGAQILDVRELDEWNEGRVSGSQLIPLGEVIDRCDEISTTEPVYVICRSGVRSASACEYLRTRGVDAVNVAGGILAWLDSQREV